jgi:hypothetical protein
VKEVRETLREKYARLVALREAHLRGEIGSATHLRTLAEAFPGALRELDRAPLSELRARLRLLSAGGPLPAWAGPAFDFHRLLRAAQTARRAAGRGRDRGAAERSLIASGEPRELADGVLSPPGGRLTRWALEELARRRGLPAGRAEALLFGYLRDWT